MSILVHLASGCGGAVGPNPAPGAPLRFLVAGQSNSLSPASGAAPIASQTGLVTINDAGHSPRRFRVPTAADPNDTGLTWIKLGDLMGVPVTFNVIGVSSTTSQQWRDSLHTRITDALSAGRYTAILWTQGESDAMNQMDAETSYQNLKFLIDESRSIQPGITWIMALDGAGVFTKPATPSGPCRTAVLRLIAQGDALPGADIDSLRSDPSNFFPGLADITGPGFDRFAALWLESLSHYLK